MYDNLSWELYILISNLHIFNYRQFPMQLTFILPVLRRYCAILLIIISKKKLE